MGGNVLNFEHIEYYIEYSTLLNESNQTFSGRFRQGQKEKIETKHQKFTVLEWRNSF